MSQDQYHHYIPRFILKNFSDKTLGREGPQIQLPWRQIHTPKPHIHTTGSQSRIHVTIKMYRVLDRTITLEDVGRAYGIRNLYRDIAEDDCMRFEKLLSKMESSAARFIKQILSESQNISLTRTRLTDFKKFLVIMMYRNDSRRLQYAKDSFDNMTRLSVQRHMQFNNISTIQEVWFENLKWILKTPVDDIVNELMRSEALKDPLAALATYKGPIHLAELMDIGVTMTMYVCIWEAQEGSEFILSDNCFGCFEGHFGVMFHNFFVVSPKYAVVLVKREYMWDAMKGLPFRKSWFEEFHANPDTIYTKKDAKGAEDFTPDDVFKYRRIVIPRSKVWLVNGIFLDVGHKYISYRSNLAMYRSLVYYDNNKDKLFDHKHDYSILKRQLVDEINRTHST